MDRRVTPPKRVTSPTWGPPPPCKQALKFLSFTQSTLKLNIPPALDLSLVSKAIYLITWQLILVLKYVITCVPLFSLIQIFLPRKSKLDYTWFCPLFLLVIIIGILVGYSFLKHFNNSC